MGISWARRAREEGDTGREKSLCQGTEPSVSSPLCTCIPSCKEKKDRVSSVVAQIPLVLRISDPRNEHIYPGWGLTSAEQLCNPEVRGSDFGSAQLQNKGLEILGTSFHPVTLSFTWEISLESPTINYTTKVCTYLYIAIIFLCINLVVEIKPLLITDF